MLQPIIHALNAKRIVLASSSPRRKEILGKVDLKFEVIPSTFEENVDKSKFPHPQDYVLETARLKVENVIENLKDSIPDLLIGADTVVSKHDDIIEKPKDRDDAIRNLLELSGRSHNVYTGVVLFVPASSPVMQNGKTSLSGLCRYVSFVEKTEVKMVEMDRKIVEAYVDTGEPMDKAGGYGIQAIGASLVEGVNGDYYNVMGFPLCTFAKEIAKLF